MALRNTLLSTGLLGLLSTGEAQAEDAKDTGLTHAEVRKELYDKATRVSYDTWKQQVLDYDGAALVLFNSSCNQTEQADILDKNLEIVYIDLIDKFTDTDVSNLPLRFQVYDVCGKSKNESLGVDGPWPKTNMYLNGRLLDSKAGAPASEKGIVSTFQNMSTWIEYNLLNIKDPGDEGLVVLYKSGTQLKPYPKSEIKN